MDPLDPRHGTTAGHRGHRNAGEPACRPCLEARAAYQRDYRAGKSGAGTKEPLAETPEGQSLVNDYIAGMTTRQIAKKYGIPRSTVGYVLRKRSVTRTATRQSSKETGTALTGGDWVIDPVRRIQVWRAA